MNTFFFFFFKLDNEYLNKVQDEWMQKIENQLNILEW